MTAQNTGVRRESFELNGSSCVGRKKGKKTSRQKTKGKQKNGFLHALLKNTDLRDHTDQTGGKDRKERVITLNSPKVMPTCGDPRRAKKRPFPSEAKKGEKWEGKGLDPLIITHASQKGNGTQYSLR